jgi:alginate export protein
MKKSMLKGAIILGGVLSIFTANAQFTVTGEIRPRAEYRNGYRSLATVDMNPAFFIEQRTRLNFGYKSEGYIFKITFQDVRTWGNEPQLIVGDGKWTTIHETWAKIILSDKLALKVGRQEISYDDERIFGPVGWAQQARSHDAAILQFNQNEWKADLVLAFNQDRPQSTTTYYSTSANYKALQTLWINRKTENFEGSFLFLNNGLEGGTEDNPKINYSQTIGTRLGGKINDWTGHFEFYYQGGKLRNGTTKLNASLIGFDLKYKISKPVSALLGYQRLSGNSQINQDTTVSNAFTPFFGTNHKFNGYMDYFYVGNFIGSVGLNDLYLRLNFSKPKIGLSGTVHSFAAANEVAETTGSGAMNDYLGTEVDLVISYKRSKDVNFKAGYSQMFATSTMAAIKGGSINATSNWAWLMVTIKPTLFNN